MPFVVYAPTELSQRVFPRSPTVMITEEADTAAEQHALTESIASQWVQPVDFVQVRPGLTLRQPVGIPVLVCGTLLAEAGVLVWNGAETHSVPLGDLFSWYSPIGQTKIAEANG